MFVVASGNKGAYGLKRQYRCTIDVDILRSTHMNPQWPSVRLYLQRVSILLYRFPKPLLDSPDNLYPRVLRSVFLGTRFNPTARPPKLPPSSSPSDLIAVANDPTNYKYSEITVEDVREYVTKARTSGSASEFCLRHLNTCLVVATLLRKVHAKDDIAYSTLR